MAARIAAAVPFPAAVVFLAAWPWEIFQRIGRGPTVVLAASALIVVCPLFHEAAQCLRRMRLPKGLGLPVALIAAACLQSALHSADPAASRALITKYLWYLLLFGMAAPLFRRPGDAALAGRVFAVSAGLVGVCAVCCAAGWLTPALAGTHEYFGRRLTEDVRVGAFVRIAATTPDYNQAILPMLLALPFLLVWTANPVSRRTTRLAAAILALFVVAGVTVSFSRSGLLAVMGVFAGGGLLLVRARVRKNGGQPSPPAVLGQGSGDDSRGTTSPDRLPAVTPIKGGSLGQAPSPVDSGHGSQDDSRGRLSHMGMSAFTGRRVGLFAGLAVVALSLAVLVLAGGYSEMLVRRALRGFNSPDPSYKGRLYVFGLAFKLLPKYALFGCGIGASGAAIGTVAEPAKWFGTAIHSIPLLFWFETGLLGLIGYFWFWWRVVRRVWAGLMRSPEAEQRQLGIATLGALAVLFWMLAVQPFQELSLFPVFAALAIGPACGSQSAGGPGLIERSKRGILVPVCGLTLLALLVTANLALYARMADGLSAYAVTLEKGLAAEQRGDWETGQSAYASAGELARNAPLRPLYPTLPRMPFYMEAFHAADLEFVFLRLPGRGGPSVMPADVARFGAARCLWNAGAADAALQQLETGWLTLFWPEAAYAAGEMRWQHGDCEAALKHWKNADASNRQRKPFPPLEYPFDVAPSMDELYRTLDAEAQALTSSTDPADVARRVALLLRLNRREEAAAALQAAPAGAPELTRLRDALRVRP